MRSSKRIFITVAVGAVVAVATLGAAQSFTDTPERSATHQSGQGPRIAIKDARLKFEINATDQDGGVQLFLDADSWKSMSLYDPDGHRVFTATTEGRMSEQGGTELFLESAEPPFSELPLAQLLERWPAGKYAVRGVGPEGERYAGTAVLTHDIPDGPELVSPLEDQGLQDPDDTAVRWEPVGAADGSPIIGYQVLVVQPETGMKALPKIILDVMMPPNATELRVPPGFLAAGTEYEWEVLALEAGGNQTLSSAFFTTSG